MNQEAVCGKLTQEIIECFRLHPDCYDFIYLRIEMAYTAGFEFGNKRGGKPKSIVQLTLDGEIVKVWDNMSTAARALGVDRSNMNKCATNRNKTLRGFKWKYPDKLNN